MSLNRLLVTLVRHGESQDNQQGIWAGFRDTPLTTNGISQARSLGQFFANVPLTAIYCSDLKRAAMTADEILKSNRSIPPPPLVQSKSLREINFGQAEGQSYASAEWMQGSSGDDARNFRFPEGESLEEVNARIAKAVRQFILPRVEALRKKPPSQVAASGDVGHICIVAHGIAIAELLRVFMALHDDSPSSPWPDPKISYQRVRLENTGWSRLELAVPYQGDEEHPNNPSMANNAMRSQSTNSTPAVTVPAGTQPDYTDFGEVQTDLVEGPTDALTHQDSSVSAARSGVASRSTPLQPESSARPIYVRILCQNQTDHLRGFNLQQSSSTSAAKAVAHLAGGGASKTSTGNSPAPGAALQHQNSSNATSSATVGLPSSATLASIASNATSSNSHTNTSMTPSTPAIGPTLANNGATKSTSTTPASARSLVAYDSRMMARELERAGAASMLAGSEAATSSGAGATYYPSSTSTSTLAGERQGSIAGFNSSTGSGSTSGLDRNAFTTSPAVGTTLGSAHTTSSQSGSSAAPVSSLFGTYPPSASTALPNATSPNPAGVSFPVGPGSSSDTWQMICIRVLPLFNGEALRTSIEELNEMVSLHVRQTLERSQSHAIESLTLDLISLTSTGTLTLNSKLQGLDDSRLLLRLVEVWTFFLGQVLPYCEGCFLPLQTDPTLRSLISSSLSHGGGVGGIGAGAGANSANAGLFSSSANLSQSGAALLLSGAANAGHELQRIDVRKILLIVFRDQVLMPIYERLFYLFAHLSELDPAFSAAEDTTSTSGGGDDGIKQVSLRLLQMISVLASILSDDDAQDAMDNLLRALRLGSKSASAARSRGAGDGLGARSTSPTQRNNRRGWMAQKARKHGAALGLDMDASKGPSPFGPSSTLGSVSGILPSTQSTSEGFGGAPQRAYLTRPSHLTNFRDPLGPRFGADMTEDEYLTSLRSPAGSPAISTPGNAEAPSTPTVDQTESSSLAKAATAGPQSEDDQAAMTPIAGQRGSLPFGPNKDNEPAAPAAALAA